MATRGWLPAPQGRTVAEQRDAIHRELVVEDRRRARETGAPEPWPGAPGSPTESDPPRGPLVVIRTIRRPYKRGVRSEGGGSYPASAASPTPAQGRGSGIRAPGREDPPSGRVAALPIDPEPAPTKPQLDSIARYEADPWGVPPSSARCLEGTASMLLVDPETGEIRVARFRCRSWRCPWCGPQVARREFARISTALSDGETRGKAPQAAWLLLCLTFDPKRYASRWKAYAAAYGAWNTLKTRLRRRFGTRGRSGRMAPLDYVAVYERHASGWPHVHLVLRAPGMAEEIAELGQWDRQPWRRDRLGKRVPILAWEREVLRPLAVEAGFGRITDLQTAKGMGTELVAGYLTKLASEVAGVKAYQCPVDAPIGFRRIRSSRGILPPIDRGEGRLLGRLVYATPEVVATGRFGFPAD